MNIRNILLIFILHRYSLDSWAVMKYVRRKNDKAVFDEAGQNCQGSVIYILTFGAKRKTTMIENGGIMPFIQRVLAIVKPFLQRKILFPQDNITTQWSY